MKNLRIVGLFVALCLVSGAVFAFGAGGASGASEAIASPAMAQTATASDSADSQANTDSQGADTSTDSSAYYEPMRPTEGIGQPVPGGWDYQPQASAVGASAKKLHNALLLPIITFISLFVLALLGWVVIRYRASANPVPSTVSHNTKLEIIWTAVPIVILLIIAVPSIGLLNEQYKPPSKDALVIKVTGYQWNWGYAYPDYAIEEYISSMITDPAEAEARGEPFQLAVDHRMVVPVGREVKLQITGGDVIHSFAVPALWTKMDAVPGKLNETTFTVDKVGVYYGQCSELCGIDHAYMPIAVEALPQDQFEAWVRWKGGQIPNDNTDSNNTSAEETASADTSASEVAQTANADETATIGDAHVRGSDNGESRRTHHGEDVVDSAVTFSGAAAIRDIQENTGSIILHTEQTRDVSDSAVTFLSDVSSSVVSSQISGVSQ